MARKQGNPPTTHTVEAGDSLFDIAQAYYGAGDQWSKISAANGNIQPPDLKLGQTLKIPSLSSQPQPTTTGKVVAYQHAEYTGDSQTFEVGKYDVGQLKNDSISSLKVPSGMTVVLYEHARFGGSSKAFTADAPYVGNDFNDTASSLIIKANGSSPTTGPSTGPTTGTSSGFAKIVSQQTFETMFPNRNRFYTYSGLVAATKKYPKFCNDGTSEQNKREAAAFLANISHETGSLKAIEEENKANWPHYCQTGQYPCVPGKTYHGRGPMQLSWNYNYAACGKALGIDLLNNPDRVATDSAVAFMSALWFWMTPQPPKAACHTAINASGFGATINIINGGLECGQQNNPKVQHRIQLYKQFTSELGVSPGSNLSC